MHVFDRGAASATKSLAQIDRKGTSVPINNSYRLLIIVRIHDIPNGWQEIV